MRSVNIIKNSGDDGPRRVTLKICGRVRVYREFDASRSRHETSGPRWRQVKRRRRRRPGKSMNPASRPRPVVRRSKRRTDPYASAVRRIMSKHGPSFRDCFRAAQRRDRSISGAVVIRFTIDRRGRVIEAMPEVNQLTPGVGSCIVNRIRDLRFPCPRGE